MSKTKQHPTRPASPPRISGIGFSALQIQPGRWVIITNPLFGETVGYTVSDVFRGDASVARRELREWGRLYEAGLPRAGETVRTAA